MNSERFVGNKKNKVWLLYAYDRKSGEMVVYVWGRRDYKDGQATERKTAIIRPCL